MKAGNWTLASAVACVAVALSMPAAAQNDSAIVHAAKQKASEKKAGHVFTNEDFPESPEASGSAAASDTAAPAEADQGDSAASDASAKPGEAKAGEKKADSTKSADDAKSADEAKLKDLEAKLAAAKKGEADLQAKLATLQEKADIEKDDFRRNMYLDMITNQQVTLSEFRRTQESLQAQIEQEKEKTQPKTPDQE